MKKQFPDFATDAEAETFVATADLSEYDFSDMTPMRFSRRPPDASINVSLPEHLLDEVRNRAEQEGMPAQRFIRLAIERALEPAK